MERFIVTQTTEPVVLYKTGNEYRIAKADPSSPLVLGQKYVLVTTDRSGPVGAQGPQGAQGFQGAQGAQGFQGTTGAQGPQGPQGFQGAQGFQGPQGDVGSTGAQGATGAQGSTGATGSQGAQGPQGFQGFQGATGSQGPQGFQGDTGPQGFQGSTGPQGPQGATGTQGAQGSQGAAGQSNSFYNYKALTTATTGNPGAGFLLWGSATQISSTRINTSHLDSLGNDIDIFLATLAVGDKIFIQSTTSSDDYQQWQISGAPVLFANSYLEFPVTYLSSGGIGATNFANNADVLFIFSRVGPQGPQGSQGATGPQGAQGPQGSQGSQGPQGFQGDVGAQGPQGFQGFQGATGSQGPQGPQGSTGATGAQGPQGPQGFTTLSAATDVAITSPSTGQALVYDSGTSKWVNTTASTDPMNDTKFTAIITMDVGV